MGYMEKGQVISCDNIQVEACRLETVSANATLLEVVTILLQSGRKRAVVQDPDGTILGTISISMVAEILGKVAR